jgi:nicotinamidase-related amidase
VPVWDRFLTDRDRAHLAGGWQKTAPFGLGAHAALLVIDNADSICGDRREELLEGMVERPLHCGVEAWDALQLTKTLLAAARRRRMTIIHTLPPVDPPIARFRGDGAARHVPPPEFHRDSRPEAGEPVIAKPWASAFQGTSLADDLTARGIDSIVVCGNATSGCVRATVVDAAGLGIRAAVVEDCTFDRTEASHALSLFDIDQKYADVISLDAALQYIEHDLVV